MKEIESAFCFYNCSEMILYLFQSPALAGIHPGYSIIHKEEIHRTLTPALYFVRARTISINSLLHACLQ